MITNYEREPIHKWDGFTLVKACLFGAILEALAIAPAILSPWGHAGPESLWGWLGLVLNLPALFVIWLLRTLTGSRETISVGGAIVYVYLIQTLIFSYSVFVCFRWKKRRKVDN